MSIFFRFVMHVPSTEVPPLLTPRSMLCHQPFKRLALLRLEHTPDTCFRRLQNVINTLSHVLARGVQLRSRGHHNGLDVLLLRLRQIECMCEPLQNPVDRRPMAIPNAVGREANVVRMENMVPASAMPYRNVTNLHFDGGDYAESVRRCAELIGFESIRARQKRGERDGRLIGVGFASFTEQTAHGRGEWQTFVDTVGGILGAPA